jgi:hypothetical protein
MKDDLLIRTQQILALRKPSKRLYMSFFNFVFNRHPTRAKDEHFAYHKDDFVMLTTHSEFNWLDDILHKFMDSDGSGILRVRFSLLAYFISRFVLNPFVPSVQCSPY